MSITKFSIGDDFVRDENGKTMVPKSGYTPAVGDGVVLDNSVSNGFDLAAADENVWGIVDWVSPDATYACVRELVPGTMVVWPISGTVNLGDKTEATGAVAAVGTGGPTRSVMRTDASNGIGIVRGTGASSPAGTGTCCVEYISGGA